MTEQVESGAAVEDVEAPSTETAETPESESTSETAEAKTEESPSEAEADGESEDEPKEWVNLVKKYDGDKAKIGQSYWRANNEAARLARENKDLKAAIDKAKAATGVAKSEPPAEKPITEHPSIQKLESEITALNGQLESMREEGLGLVKEIEAQAKKVAGLEYTINEAGELASDEQKTRLAAASDRLDLLRERFAAKREKYNEREQRLTDAQARRESVRADAEAERARQKQAAEAEAEFNKEFPEYIDSIIAEQAGAFGITPDSDRGHYLHKIVNDALIGQLYRLGLASQTISEVDHDELVKAAVAEFAQNMGLAKKAAFAELSREKAKVSPARKITPGASLTPSKTGTKPKLLQIGEPLDDRMSAARARLAAKGI